MKKFILVCAALSLVGGVAEAKSRDRDRDACKPAIQASGDAARFKSNAMKSAIKHWQEEVINQHGERYMNFSLAKISSEHCDPARVGGGMGPLSLKRCVVVARPCKSGD